MYFLLVSYYDDSNLYRQISLTGNGMSLYSKIMHKFVERNFQTTDSFPKVLEIGSDQGQHRRFVRHQYTNYILCDLHLPRKTTQDFRVQSVLGDIKGLPFGNNEFDRVIVTCVLHHLPDPELPLNEISRVTKPGGVISILVPKDPSSIYSIVRNSLLLVKHRKLGNLPEYSRLHKQQHIGHYRTIIQAVKANNFLTIEKQHKFPIPPFTLLYSFHLTRV